MNRTEGLQYIADTILIERLFPQPLNKEAGLLAEIGAGLGSLARSIYDNVVNSIDTSSAGAFSRSMLALLTPAILFRINPVIGTAVAMASQIWGIDFNEIWNALLGPVKDKALAGQQIDPGILDQAAQSLMAAVPEMAGGTQPMTAGGSIDCFEGLRKQAQFWDGGYQP